MNYQFSNSTHTLTHWQSGLKNRRGGGSSLDIGANYEHHKLSDYIDNLGNYTEFPIIGMYDGVELALTPLAWKEPDSSVQIDAYTISDRSGTIYGTAGSPYKLLYSRYYTYEGTNILQPRVYYFNVYGLEVQTLEPIATKYNGDVTFRVRLGTIADKQLTWEDWSDGELITLEKTTKGRIWLPIVRRYLVKYQLVWSNYSESQPEGIYANAKSMGSGDVANWAGAWDACFGDCEEFNDVPPLDTWQLAIGMYDPFSTTPYQLDKGFATIYGGGAIDNSQYMVSGYEETDDNITTPQLVDLDYKGTTINYPHRSGFGLVASHFGNTPEITGEQVGYWPATGTYLYASNTMIIRRIVNYTTWGDWQFFKQDE